MPTTQRGAIRLSSDSAFSSSTALTVLAIAWSCALPPPRPPTPHPPATHTTPPLTPVLQIRCNGIRGSAGLTTPSRPRSSCRCPTRHGSSVPRVSVCGWLNRLKTQRSSGGGCGGWGLGGRAEVPLLAPSFPAPAVRLRGYRYGMCLLVSRRAVDFGNPCLTRRLPRLALPPTSRMHQQFEVRQVCILQPASNHLHRWCGDQLPAVER